VVAEDGKTDNNFRKFFLFLTQNQQIPQNYYLRVALFYMGSLPEQCRLDIDYAAAESYFREELKKYPNNLQAEIGLLSLLFDIKKIGQKEFASKLEGILKKDFDRDDEATVKSVSRAFKMINQSDAADKLEQIFVTKHPNSKLAEEKMLIKLANAPSREEFVTIAKSYFQQFPKSDGRLKIFNALISAYLQNGKYQDLKTLFSGLEGVPALVKLAVAGRLIEDPNSYKEADLAVRVSEARSILSAIESDLLSNQAMPKYYSQQEKDKAIKNLSLSYNFTLAKSYVAEQNYTKAIEYFDKVWDSNQQYDAQFYELYALSLFELNKMNEGLLVLESAATHIILTDKLEEKFKEKYTTINSKSDAEFATYLDNLLLKNKDTRMKTLSSYELDNTINAGSLKTLDGKFVDLSDMKGSVVVALLWSSWCGPCQTMFPVYNDLYDVYKESDDIIILSVNIWERTDQETDLNNFLNEAEVDFPVLTDEAAFIPKNAGISGLPMTLIFGKEGNLKFKIQGFSGDKQFMADVLDRVEYLLKK
jgi:thiol-disulfide isomerase/thioredoxin/uncharacterized protein (DUF1697 family)